jgi:hypothetical protein
MELATVGRICTHTYLCGNASGPYSLAYSATPLPGSKKYCNLGRYILTLSKYRLSSELEHFMSIILSASWFLQENLRLFNFSHIKRLFYILFCVVVKHSLTLRDERKLNMYEDKTLWIITRNMKKKRES